MERENEELRIKLAAWQEVYERREQELDHRVAAVPSLSHRAGVPEEAVLQLALQVAEAQDIAATKEREAREYQLEAEQLADQVLQLQAELASCQPQKMALIQQVNKLRHSQDIASHQLKIQRKQIEVNLEDSHEEGAAAGLIAMELNIVRQMKAQLEAKVTDTPQIVVGS